MLTSRKTIAEMLQEQNDKVEYKLEMQNDGNSRFVNLYMEDLLLSFLNKFKEKLFTVTVTVSWTSSYTKVYFTGRTAFEIIDFEDTVKLNAPEVPGFFGNYLQMKGFKHTVGDASSFSYTYSKPPDL